MNNVMTPHRQGGVALVISLLFLLVVTVIAVTGARNSSMSVKLTSNVQDQNNSLQSAEAALYATLALAEGANDPFGNLNLVDPFDTVDPLNGVLNDPNTPVTSVRLVAADRECKRSQAGSGGTSADQNECNFYRIDTEHVLTGRARTQASLGVVKTLLQP